MHSYFYSFKNLFIIILFCHCSFAQLIINTPIADLNLQGHRGARGLYPENTLPAFKSAMENGMTTIELDTILTKDKQLIIHHDNTLNPKNCLWSNGDKVELIPIKNYTVTELKNLDCGALKNIHFPEQTLVPGTKLSTLKEFFQYVKEYEKENKLKKSFLFNIETKINEEEYSREDILEYARIMVNTIEEAKVVKQTTVQSFVLEVLPEIKKLNNEIATSALFAPTAFDYILLTMGFSYSRNSIIRKTLNVKAEVISPYHEYVNPEFIRVCRESKIKVIPWTVNDKKIMRTLILYGVDGIISDYPDRLKSVQLENRI